MYDMVHAMRTRIITSQSFTGGANGRVLGAILFENTMDRAIDGIPTGEFLWTKKQIVPFLKCDKGLEAEANGVQLMKPMPDLDALLQRAKAKGIFGTKMRSNINAANEAGIRAIVEQQFAVGKQIIGHGLVPILEPEVNITSPDKAESEVLLKKYLLEGLNALPEDQHVMLKVSLPSVVNHYKECIEHPRCICVVALSGGYALDEANAILEKQVRSCFQYMLFDCVIVVVHVLVADPNMSPHNYLTQKGMIASFSRALVEGLSHTQPQEEFDATLALTVDAIFKASIAG